MRKSVLLAIILASGLLLFVSGILISNWLIKSRVPVGLMSGLQVHGSEDYASASGTMTIEGESDFMPLQTTKIECSAERKECVVARAMIFPGNFLNVELSTNSVTEWGKNYLVLQEETDCVINSLSINWATQSVTGIRHLKKGRPPETCKALSVDNMRTTMRDGFKVWQEEERRAYPAFIKILHAIL